MKCQRDGCPQEALAVPTLLELEWGDEWLDVEAALCASDRDEALRILSLLHMVSTSKAMRSGNPPIRPVAALVQWVEGRTHG